MDRRIKSSSSAAAAAASSTKVERRIIEKNRRNQMKVLYSRLNSLLPNRDSQDVAPTLPDQIDEATNYIKFMEMKLKAAKEKKESLMCRKTSTSLEPSSSLAGGCSISPQLKIREMGTTLEVVLTTGLENQFIFYEIIRILEQQGAEVVNASCSVVGNSVFHTVHAEIGNSIFEFGAAKVTERLKSLVYGSTSDMELQTQWWDFDFQPQTWDF